MMVATGQCNANDGTVVMWRRLKTMLTIHLLNWGGLCSRGPVGIDHQAPISPFLPIAHSFLPVAHSFLPVAAQSLSVAPPFLLLLPQSHVSLSLDPHFFPHTFIWAGCQINVTHIVAKTEHMHLQCRFYIYSPVLTWPRNGARSSTSSSSSWPFIEKRRFVCLLLLLFVRFLLTASRIPCSWSGEARRPWSFPSEFPSCKNVW